MTFATEPNPDGCYFSPLSSRRTGGRLRSLPNTAFEDQQIRSWCAALRWHSTAYMEPPPGASERDLFHVGVNQLVCHLGGVVSIARGGKRMPCRGG